jgi:predicted HAD superfamily Cof-like phosphohydrolase
MSSIFSAIYDFNEQIVKVPLDVELNPLTKEQREWLIKALEEEIDEFRDTELDGIPLQDVIIGRVDALLDSIYFAVGGLKKMGLTRDQAVACMMAVHGANMNKKRGSHAKRGDFAEDAVKSQDWVPPEAAIRKILFGD